MLTLVLTLGPDADDLTEGPGAQLVLGEHAELVAGPRKQARHQEVSLGRGHGQRGPLVLPSGGLLHPAVGHREEEERQKESGRGWGS